MRVYGCSGAQLDRHAGLCYNSAHRNISIFSIGGRSAPVGLPALLPGARTRDNPRSGGGRSNLHTSRRSEMVIECGMEAPDFELDSHQDDRVRLSEYRGKHNVLLAFFPMAWTPV